jgi:hypothetical protein
MAFSVIVEMLNIRARAKQEAVHLRGPHMPSESGTQSTSQ